MLSQWFYYRGYDLYIHSDGWLPISEQNPSLAKNIFTNSRIFMYEQPVYVITVFGYFFLIPIFFRSRYLVTYLPHAFERQVYMIKQDGGSGCRESQSQGGLELKSCTYSGTLLPGPLQNPLSPTKHVICGPAVLTIT